MNGNHESKWKCFKKIRKTSNYEVPKGYTEHFLDHKV